MKGDSSPCFPLSFSEEGLGMFGTELRKEGPDMVWTCEYSLSNLADRLQLAPTPKQMTVNARILKAFMFEYKLDYII